MDGEGYWSLSTEHESVGGRHQRAQCQAELRRGAQLSGQQPWHPTWVLERTKPGMEVEGRESRECVGLRRGEGEREGKLMGEIRVRDT